MFARLGWTRRRRGSAAPLRGTAGIGVGASAASL